MKPCSRNRKPIAWLVLDALEAREATALREHLARCPGCHRYREEISRVAKGLASAAPDSQLEASELLCRRVAQKLRAVESSSALEGLAAWLRGAMGNWRVALPAGAVLAIALGVMFGPRHHPPLSPPASPTLQVGSASSSGSDLAPTLANYQMVANQSLEKLSELLTSQGNKSLPPAPVYTISGVEPSKVPF